MGRVRDSSDRIDLLVHAAGIEVSRALPDKEPAGVRPGARRQGRWLVQRDEGRRRPADRRDGRLLLRGGPVRERRAVRLRRRQRPAVQDHQQPAAYPADDPLHSRSTGPPGVGSGWPPEAPSPRSWRWPAWRCLPPEAGVAWIRRELTGHGFRGEVVAAGALGRMADGYHPTGGVEPATLTSWGSRFAGEVVEANLLDGLVVQTTLDPTAQPFLNDHRIDGTAVLPGVMGMEFFAEVAGLLAPERYVVAVEDVDFLRPGEVLPRRATDPRPSPRGSGPRARTSSRSAASRRSGLCRAARCRSGRCTSPVPCVCRPDRSALRITRRRSRRPGSRRDHSVGRLPAVLPRSGVPGRR